MRKKNRYSLLRKGDVIRTNPEPDYYGIAVVLSNPESIELQPGNWSYPLCHIMITPLIFKREVIIEDINLNDLKPLMFQQFFKRKDGVRIPWRLKTCIDIYTYRNISDLPVIGSVEVSEIYKEPILFKVNENGFHLCGDVTNHLGREAYINWLREREQTEDLCE